MTLSQAVAVPEVQNGWLSLRLGVCAAAEGLGPWLLGLARSGGRSERGRELRVVGADEGPQGQRQVLPALQLRRDSGVLCGSLGGAETPQLRL